jgi:hypothetical protein
MAGEATPLDALVAEMLGDIGKLHDAVAILTGTINEASANIKVTINQLEAAGEKYNQAVLAANCRSKDEMMAYLKAVSATTIAKTTEEQREIVQKLIREAVSKEITALKKALSELSANHRMPFLSSWGRIIICCSLTALMGSVITVELIQRLGIS